MTVLVQSSSTTTSLMVPLVGSGILKARDIYPFTLGANIGTCITALIAALAVTGPMGGVAMQIALVHLLFNIFSVLLIFGLPFLRNIPLSLSSSLAGLAAERKNLRCCLYCRIVLCYAAVCDFYFTVIYIPPLHINLKRPCHPRRKMQITPQKTRRIRVHQQ